MSRRVRAEVNGRTSVTSAEATGPALRRVRVWFGDHLISEWVGEAALAERMAEQERRRFSVSCRVTVEPVPDALHWGQGVRGAGCGEAGNVDPPP